jgi:hypothetical protein
MELGARLEDGASLRTHLQRLYQSTGKLDPRLEAPPIPAAGRALYEIYVSLAASRRSGMGPSPLALVDVDAYCRLTGITLTGWELDTLFLMDQTALAVATKPKAAN